MTDSRAFLTAADLVFPANRAAPIAATLAFSDGAGLAVTARLDFRHTGPARWDIDVETAAGPLALSGGGRRLVAGGTVLVDREKAEYPALYRHFIHLIASGASDVDLAPLVHVADAFMLGRRTETAPYED